MKMRSKKQSGIVLGIALVAISACNNEDPLATSPAIPKVTEAASIDDVRYPQSVSAGEEILVQWRVKGLSEQAAHRLTWYSSAMPTAANPVGATLVSAEEFSVRFIAPENASAISFVIQSTDYDGRSAQSNQFAISVTSKPSVQILEAPTQVSANDSVKIRWSFNGSAMLTSNVIRWGTSPGQYAQNSLGGRLGGSGQYTDEFIAPNGVEKIYFMIQIVDANGVYVSDERSISVASAAANITIDSYPAAVQTSATIEVRWTVKDAKVLNENRIFWGTQSGQLNAVSAMGVPTGNNGFVAEFVAPAVSASIYFVVRASDETGSFQTAETRIQVSAGPAVMVDALPRSTVTESNVDVIWAVTGVTNVSSTVLEWGTASGNYSQTVQGVANAGKFKASFLTPVDASQTVYLRAVAFHSQGRTESTEHVIQLTQAPSLTIESAPTAAQTTSDIEVVWSFTDAVNVTANAIRWGDAPGVYTNDVVPTETLATNRFRTVFTAPGAPQVVYFVAEITDSNGTFQSVEHSVAVGGAPSIEILRAPRLGVAAQVLEVEWRLNNMNAVTQNEVRWGPIPGVFFYTENNVQSLGNNRYMVRFSAPVSGGLVSLQIRAADSHGSHRSSTHNVVIIPTPAIQFQSLPGASQASQPITLTWQVSNVSNIDRQFITWSYTSGQLTNQTTDATVSGSDYTATIPVPSQLGSLYFAINIESQGSSVVSQEIEVVIVPGSPISVPDTQSAVTIIRDAQHLYSFGVTQGTTYEITMTPQASGGDIDLYVSEDVQISRTNYACRPYSSGTAAEVCTFVASADGFAHILVHGYRDGGYDLETVSR